MKNKTHADLAGFLGVNIQSVSNKFYRGSFSAIDLIKIAEFLNCDLAFVFDDKQRIILDRNDIIQKDNDDAYVGEVGHPGAEKLDTCDGTPGHLRRRSWTLKAQ